LPLSVFYKKLFFIFHGTFYISSTLENATGVWLMNKNPIL